MSKELFDELAALVTEARNPASMDIDSLSVTEVLQLINREDQKVPGIITGEIPQIARAVDAVVAAFRRGGRLIYVGAGTSGRLGVLDAAECPPTFGTPPRMVQGVIAGGFDALVRAQEGSEDRGSAAREDLEAIGVEEKDVVCGLAASSRTPYALAAIDYAREKGAATIFVTCAPREKNRIPADIIVCPVVGPEVVMGSTRMKAGTAQKLVLNMITTTAMIQIGKVYENMMVDLQMNSKKLEERCKRTIMIVTGLGYDAAQERLETANGHVKTALVMELAGVDAAAAAASLEQADGRVRQAIELARRREA